MLATKENYYIYNITTRSKMWMYIKSSIVYGHCVLCFLFYMYIHFKKLHGLSPRANYTDGATAASRRSDCQLLRIKGAMWSA
jgi:hypothetical protein